MAESEEFTTETGCRVRVIERDRDFLLELRMPAEDGRRAEVLLTPWELYRLHAATFRPPQIKHIPTAELLGEIQRRITTEENR